MEANAHGVSVEFPTPPQPFVDDKSLCPNWIHLSFSYYTLVWLGCTQSSPVSFSWNIGPEATYNYLMSQKEQRRRKAQLGVLYTYIYSIHTHFIYICIYTHTHIYMHFKRLMENKIKRWFWVPKCLKSLPMGRVVHQVHGKCIL